MFQNNDPAMVCCGRPVTHQEIKDVQETVSLFSYLSLYELTETICEHLNWRRASGNENISYVSTAVPALGLQFQKK